MQSLPPQEMVRQGSLNPETGTISGSIPVPGRGSDETAKVIDSLKTELMIAYRAAHEKADMVIKLQNLIMELKMREAKLLEALQNK